LSHRASILTGNESGYSLEQDADRMRMTDRGAALATSWDFSKIPIYPPERTPNSITGFSSTLAQATDYDCGSTYPDPQSRRSTALRPRIDRGAIRFHRLPSDEAGGVVPGADGSPDDLEDLEDDQDALTPSVFERRPNGRGVHIRVPGGTPGGTADHPDGVRWIQTINTNAPLHGLSPPYGDFIPPADDGKPFYFTDARENATFSDNPSRSRNSVWWDATLSLVGVAGRNITRLDSVNYGFDLDASGTLTLHGPSTTGVADIVIQGDTLRSTYPDWVFSGGFAVPQVPGGAVTGGTGMA
jgi:hypothetical protein